MNPWLSLPSDEPRVLSADFALIEAFNDGRSIAAGRYDLSLWPEPFFGRPDAPVVLLALNPGLGPDDHITHAQDRFGERVRASLAHQLEPWPFLHLQSQPTLPGEVWWHRITTPLREAVGVEQLSRSLLCVQFFPYHSKVFRSGGLRVPSQDYGFGLVRAAIDRGAVIVVMRSWKLWVNAVPALEGAREVVRVRNPRNPTLSAANLGAGFSKVVNIIRGGV
jgi:hypothetical protein